MKNKLFSIFTALAMVLGILVAPFTSAQATDDAVTPPTGVLEKDQLSATKPDKTEIELYKLTTKESYKAGAPWEHTGGKIADTSKLGTDVQPLQGAKFTFYKIKGADDKENEKILALLDKNKTMFETATDMESLIANGKTGLTASEKDANLTQIEKGKLEKVTVADSESLTDGETAETGADGKVNFKLADGYYWAIESKKPEKVTGAIAVPFGLTLPLMNSKEVDGIKAGTQYLKKLYIYPKNIQTNDVKIDKNHANYNAQEKKWYDKDGQEVQAGDLGAEYDKYSKEKKSISAQLGEERRFESKTEIPRNYTFEEFSWSDIMSEGLTYKTGSLKVTYDYINEDGQKKENETFIDENTNNSFLTEKSNGFDILVKKAETEQTLVKYLKNGSVTFHFSYVATVNNHTVVDKPQTNSITFEPGKPDNGGKVKSKEGKIKITKTWSKNGANQDTPTATDITYYLLNANGETLASVTVKAGTAENTKIDAGKGITFVVGKTLGSGEFQGLANAETEYTVREAVAGYKPTYNNGSADVAEETLPIENKDKPEVKKPTEPKIVFHGKKFVKMDQIGDATRLFGAEFVIKNNSVDTTNPDKGKFLVVKHSDQKVEEIEAVKQAKKNLDDKIDEFNKLSAEKQKEQKATFDTAINGLQKAYNEAVVAQRTSFTWEEGTGANKATPPADAYKVVSDGEGRFEITGLSAGDYQLVEVKAPVGYATNETPIPFTVKDGSYTKDESDKAIHYNKNATQAEQKDAQRVDNKKLTIPQTGGIGSLIFIVAGVAIMAFAYTAYRKSQYQEA